MMPGDSEDKSALGKIETLDLVKSAERRVMGRNGGGARVLS